MKYTFLGYPKCSTSKKAEKWMNDNGFDYTFRDIVIDHPNEKELTEWISRSGLPLKRFFNTSGLSYKALHLKDKLPTMSEDEQMKLLATDGKLVKRPLLIAENFVLPGFKQEEWEEKVK